MLILNELVADCLIRYPQFPEVEYKKGFIGFLSDERGRSKVILIIARKNFLSFCQMLSRYLSLLMRKDILSCECGLIPTLQRLILFRRMQ